MILNQRYDLNVLSNIAAKGYHVKSWDILLRVIYLCLQLIDLELTLIASQLGFLELNPLMRMSLMSPFHLALFKVGIPLLICIFVPGRFLIPGIVLLSGIICWNIKELLTLLF